MEVDNILTLHDTINPKFWINNALNEQVREKLVLIANDFFQDLSLEGGGIEDITFTGSLANLNWTKFSDVDLHLLVKFSEIDENYDLVREYFSAKTSNWNKNHNISILGHEVEIYVQDIGEEHHSTGVYSIKNAKWLAEPTRVAPNVDVSAVKIKIESFSDMIERAEDLLFDQKHEEAYNFSLKLVKKIKKFRQSGLEDKGEYSNENLTFKYLRNNGNIKTLFDTRNESYDKMMSIEGDFTKKFKIFTSQEEEDQKAGFHRISELKKYQQKVKRRHKRLKVSLLGQGKQKTGVAYPKKPSYRRGKSAPPGVGGS